MASSSEDAADAARAARARADEARTTTQDLYALLDLDPPTAALPTSTTTDEQDPHSQETTAAALSAAWRRAARAHHPDKNRGDEPAAAARYDAARKAFEILSDERARAVYDGRVRAEAERKRALGAMDARKRRLVEELRAAEERGAAASGSGAGSGLGTAGAGAGAGTKRRAAGEEETLEEKMARVAASTRRRREEVVEARRREAEEAERMREADEADAADLARARARASKTKAEKMDGYTRVDVEGEEDVDMDVDDQGEGADTAERMRRIRVRWPSATPAVVTQQTLTAIFTPFGAVEKIELLPDKRHHPTNTAEDEGKTKKILMGSANVTFASPQAARTAAVQGVRLVKRDDSGVWKLLDRIMPPALGEIRHRKKGMGAKEYVQGAIGRLNETQRVVDEAVKAGALAAKVAA